MTQIAMTGNPALRQRPAQNLPGEDRSQSVYVSLVALYLFVLVSRVLDLLPLWSFHIPMLLAISATVLTLARGDLRITFHSKIAITFALFTAWIVICVPFSKWRAASLGPLETQVESLVIFVIIVQASRTPEAYRKITGAYAYAVLIAVLMSFHYGRTVENGRLALAWGTLGDPNELALTLVTGLPFWWDKATAAVGVKKIYYLLCTVPILIIFGKTGSRSGLFALAVLIGVAFLLASAGRKMLIAVGCAILILASTFVLPQYLRERYQTIFSGASGRDAAQLQSDINSSNARRDLLTLSIQMTFEHPIFGVGPGVFSFAGFDERKAETGHGGAAQVTHNTYTQFSSETGIPGFILFSLTMLMVLRSSFRAYKRLMATNSVLAANGRHLFCLLAAFAVGIFFLSVGYTHIVSSMFAFAVALSNLGERAVAEPARKELGIGGIAAPALLPAKSATVKPLFPATVTATGPVANSKALRTAGIVTNRKIS